MASITSSHDTLRGVYLPGNPPSTKWDIHCDDGRISSIVESGKGSGQFAIPSLCHPHIHLDKAYLLSHPNYSDLQVKSGDFFEALSLTAEAKSRFTPTDLLARGRALINASVAAGVTHMRAFVEVDPVVGMKCLEAGLALKAEFQGRCYVQICVFAQDPIFSYADTGKEMQELLVQAVQKEGVEVIGSTPYVEKGGMSRQIKNIQWAIDLALKHNLHLDFHIDYNLDSTQEPAIHHAIRLLHQSEWPAERTAVFGHCTRLTLFKDQDWHDLRASIGTLPISFIGLPTSDLFMIGRPNPSATNPSNRPRGTLQVTHMIKHYDINAAIGINNVGNAFTPHGSCDPLSLACLGVGIYQAGTKADAELLLQCVSTRAKAAIGLTPPSQLETGFRVGDPADFVVFQNTDNENGDWVPGRKTVQDVVYDAGHKRTTFFGGHVVSVVE